MSAGLILYAYTVHAPRFTGYVAVQPTMTGAPKRGFISSEIAQCSNAPMGVIVGNTVAMWHEFAAKNQGRAG